MNMAELIDMAKLICLVKGKNNDDFYKGPETLYGLFTENG